MHANRFWLALPFLVLSLDARAAEPPLARMDQVIQSLVDAKRFMGTVLVVKDGKIVLDKGYGSADLAANVPNTPATRFRIGSITKQFTAASILLLEERGKLKVTDPVRQYLPDLPQAWDKITIYNLLTHTSGIFNYTSLPDSKQMKSRHATPAELVARVQDKPLEFSPGEKMKYTNTGYVVLGMVIEKVGGMPYAQFLQDNIFMPLGMKDTGYEVDAIPPPRAQGYERTADGTLAKADFIDMSTPFAAGGLYSTTHDLLTWEKALFAGKVVKPADVTRMMTPFKNDYGFGLVIRDRDGHRLVWHNGGIDGFVSDMGTYPADHLTVIVLGNIATGAPADIGGKLADLEFGKPVLLTSERKEVPVDAAILARYVGHYRVDDNFAVDITQDGNILYGQGTRQPKAQLFAEGPKDFFLKVVDGQVTFIAEGEGPATSLVLHQNGQNITGTRVP